MQQVRDGKQQSALDSNLGIKDLELLQSMKLYTVNQSVWHNSKRDEWLNSITDQ